jgi:hypothetical protein
MTIWQDSDFKVTAVVVPRYFWTTASIDVFLADECLLRTGGVFRLTGTNRTDFVYNGEPHFLVLSWQVGRGIDLLYQLSIDGKEIADSKIRLRNWPFLFLPIAALGAGVLIFGYVRARI